MFMNEFKRVCAILSLSGHYAPGALQRPFVLLADGADHVARAKEGRDKTDFSLTKFPGKVPPLGVLRRAALARAGRGDPLLVLPGPRLRLLPQQVPVDVTQADVDQACFIGISCWPLFFILLEQHTHEEDIC